MLPETECPGLHTRYAKTDNYFRDLLLISYRKGSFNYLSVSATWVLQPESEINDNGTAKNCYCQRILRGKCWYILMMGSSTIAETDGQTDHPDLKVAGGHGLFTCNSGLIHPTLLWSTETAQHTSPLWSLGCEMHLPWRKILGKSTFHVISAVSSRMKNHFLGFFCERKMGFFCMDQQVEELLFLPAYW